MDPAAVLIDISRLLGRTDAGRLPTGVDRVCLAYVAHYRDKAQAVLQWRGWRRIAPLAASRELFDLLLAPPADFRARVAAVIARACVPPWPRQDAEGRIYLNLGHTHTDAEGSAPWLRRTRQRSVFLVHDLIPLTHPEYCRAGEAARHAARLRTILESGAGLIANSRDTLEGVRAFARDHSLPLPPAVAAPIGPGALHADRASASPLPHPYFVVLGTIEPRKNHLLLLHIWRQIVAARGADAPHLVVIGQRGWECENVLDLLERCESIRGHVHELGSCDDAALARWLQHARALLMPSFAEGYGMPLAEAITLGTPAIASDLAVFREAAGDVPDYLDPLDGPAWVEAVNDYAAAQSSRRDAQLQRMQGFPVPTWPSHFARVDDLLETLR